MDFGASIIAVIQISGSVISICHKYISAVKDCPSDLRTILIETSSLKAAIENLDFLYNKSADPELKASFAKLDGNNGPITGSRICLQKLENLLPSKATGGTGKKKRSVHPTLERLAWPLHESKAKKLLDELGRHRSSITLAITTDISQLVRGVDKNVKLIRNKLDADTREKILKWVTRTDPSSLHNSTSALRDQNTGLWLNKSPEYNEWKAGRTSLIWLHGIPGAGKTVLFSYIVHDISAYCRVEQNNGFICIYYYCYFGRNQDESDHLLSWIVNQLCRHAKWMPSSITSLFEMGQEPSTTDLLDAISELSSRFNRIYLLVDGADESLKRYNLLRVLQLMQNDQSSNINVLVMSREEGDIRIAMENRAAKVVSLSNPFVDEDIATYVQNELAENARLALYPDGIKREIESALVVGAHGMFRWAACQVDILSRLHTIAEVRVALRSLPKGLDATYEQILLNIPEEYRNRARMALLLLSDSDKCFKQSEILAEAIMVDVVSLSYDETDRILRPNEFLKELCTCLVTIDRIDSDMSSIELAHYTVKEFLYSERIKSSAVKFFESSKENARFTGMMVAFTYLLNISYRNVPSVEEYFKATPTERQELEAMVKKTFPFLFYGADFWHSDLKDPVLDEKIGRVVVELFQPGKLHYRWWEWRAISDTGDAEWLHPVWTREEGMEANVALSIACFFEMPGVAARVLQAAPNLLRDERRLTLQPDYAKYLILNFLPGNSNGSDMYERPNDYLPKGTPLEVALRLESSTCLELILEKTPNIAQYVNPEGFSAFSIAVKSVSGNFQNDFRVDNISILLSAGADVNIHPVTETPLQSAARLLEYDIIKALLEAGAFINEVADDDAIVDRLGRDTKGTETDRLEVIRNRGYDIRYMTPLRIALDEIEKRKNRGWGDGAGPNVLDLLQEWGGLSLHLFPVADLPGYVSEDWRSLEGAGWHGVRNQPGR